MPPPVRALPPARASASAGESTIEAQSKAKSSFRSEVMGCPVWWSRAGIFRVAPSQMQGFRDVRPDGGGPAGINSGLTGPDRKSRREADCRRPSEAFKDAYLRPRGRRPRDR